MVKTNNGEEWTVEVEDDYYAGSIYASDRYNGMMEIFVEPEEETPAAKPSTKVVHISEIRKGDELWVDDEKLTAKSDAYMVKTGIGREWNIEAECDGEECYLYASEFPNGMVDLIVSEAEANKEDEHEPF